MPSGFTEFYSPVTVVDAARDVMGGIDLDPASSLAANAVVGAKQFFTQQGDGLAHEWWGRVWCNPPFRTGQQWAEHALREWQSGRVAAMCFLIAESMSASGNSALLRQSAAICIPEGRLAFWSPDDGPRAPLRGGRSHIVVYLGPDPEAFCERFLVVGTTFRTFG